MGVENPKEISEMTNREILRHQLEQLAEVSTDCMPEELPKITYGMISLVAYLEGNENMVDKNTAL